MVSLRVGSFSSRLILSDSMVSPLQDTAARGSVRAVVFWSQGGSA
jgi:hypothetical protein